MWFYEQLFSEMALKSNVRVWATAVSKHAESGRKIIFRYAKELNENFNRQSQPLRIIIVWKFVSENGQPTSDDHQRMDQLEDALEAVLDHSSFATLAIVSTGESLREWIYYAASESEFLARLNYALTELPAFPIEIHTAVDPNWKTYEDFAEGVRAAKC